MARPRTPRRGFAALVAALREVKRRRPDAEIAFFGCPDLAEHGIDFPHVDFGVLPNDRLRRVYNDAAIYLDTSEFQGFGRPALEAMACGCATVLGRDGGVTEYARDGENTLLVDSTDHDAVALPGRARTLSQGRSCAPLRRGRLPGQPGGQVAAMAPMDGGHAGDAGAVPSVAPLPLVSLLSRRHGL
jgi:hypothetical protein